MLDFSRNFKTWFMMSAFGPSSTFGMLSSSVYRRYLNILFLRTCLGYFKICLYNIISTIIVFIIKIFNIDSKCNK